MTGPTLGEQLLAARVSLEREHATEIETSEKERQQVASWRAGGGPATWSDALDLAAAALLPQLGDLYGLHGIYFETPELAVAALGAWVSNRGTR